jgi:hypothetical protein
VVLVLKNNCVLLAEVVGGSPEAGDDIVELGWFPAAEPLPDMAFEADRHIIERYVSTGLTGAPVDPRYSHPRLIDEDRTVCPGHSTRHALILLRENLVSIDTG